MKRAVVTGIACALLVAGVAWATQTWRDNESMGGFSLTDPTHAGGGPLCVQYDNTGKLTSAGAPCGAGLGGSAGVSSVTGTAQHISATPTTGAVVVDTIGGYSTGAVTGGNVSMGALASGVNEQVTTAGVAAPLAYAAVSNDIQVGAASNGGLTQYSTLAFNGTKLSVGQSTFDATDHFVLADNTSPTGVASWDNRYATFGQSGPTGGAVSFSYGNAAATGYMTVAVPNSAFVHFQANAADYAWYAGGTSLVEHQDVFGVYDALLTTNGLMKTTGGTGLHAIASAGTDYQLPLAACTDYVSLSCVSGTTDLGGSNATPTVIGIETGAAMRGDVTATMISTPSAPAVGKLNLYGNSATFNFEAQTSGGVINHGIQTDTCAASKWINFVGDSGQTACTQPAFTDVSGTLACGQLPAFTGDITKASGSCATVNPTKGQVWVDAADAANNSPDYLANKLVASSTVALTPITSHDGLLQASVIPSGVGAALSYYTQQWATVRTSAFGTLNILSNKQTVIAVANGMDQGWAVTAAGGTSIPTTIAANFINFPVYFYGFGTLAHVALNVNILNLVSSGSGTGTIVIELFSQNLGNPGTAANYTSLGSVSQSFTAAGATFFMGLNTTLSALSAGGLVLAVYRSDSTSTLTVSNGIAFTATLVASNP